MDPLDRRELSSGLRTESRPVREGFLQRFIKAVRRLAREAWVFCVGRTPVPIRNKR
jgi:hypothetical protein